MASISNGSSSVVLPPPSAMFYPLSSVFSTTSSLPSMLSSPTSVSNTPPMNINPFTSSLFAQQLQQLQQQLQQPQQQSFFPFSNSLSWNPQQESPVPPPPLSQLSLSSNPLSSLLTAARIGGDSGIDPSSENSNRQQVLSALTMLSVERQRLQLQQQQLQQLTAQHQQTLQTQAANLHTHNINKLTSTTSTISPSAITEFQLSETSRKDTLMPLVANANAVAAKTRRTGTGTTAVPLLSLLTESMLCGLLPQTVVKDLLESNRRSVSSLSRKFKNRWVRSTLKTLVSYLEVYYSNNNLPGKFSPFPSTSSLFLQFLFPLPFLLLSPYRSRSNSNALENTLERIAKTIKRIHY
jgi:hypothetical protein